MFLWEAIKELTWLNLYKDFLQQDPSLSRRELASGLQTISIPDIRQVEEKIEAFYKRRWQRRDCHTVDDAVGSHRQEIDRAQEHPTIARLLSRLDLQELDDGTAGCIWKSQ